MDIRAIELESVDCICLVHDRGGGGPVLSRSLLHGVRFFRDFPQAVHVNSETLL
jgi:hypothetical protein